MPPNAGDEDVCLSSAPWGEGASPCCPALQRLTAGVHQAVLSSEYLLCLVGRHAHVLPTIVRCACRASHSYTLDPPLTSLPPHYDAIEAP
eukprot:scaffold8878_cov27-Tisochrysis_lutea.AAC.1